MNNERIQQLLDELYQIDGSLREHEGELMRALEILISAKPDLRPTPEFVAQLKGQLSLRAHSMGVASVQNTNWLNFFTMQNKFVTSVVVVVAVVVAVGSALFVNRPSQELAYRAESIKVANNAFGPLSGSQEEDEDATASVPAGLGAAPSEASGVGRGGGGFAPASIARPQSGGGGMDKSAMSIAPGMPYQGETVYEYVYEGEPLDLQAGTVEVLKRIKGGLAPLGNVTRSISGVNLNSFSSLGIQNVNLSEDKDYGYSIYADFSEGSLSINQNWLRWPNPMAECRDEACTLQYRIKPEQVLADGEAIQIANAFLDDHSIDRSALGQPEVQSDWRVMYEKMSASDRLAFWVPEQVTLVYPLIIDDKTVYEQGVGMKMGINVSVDIRTKRVASLYNIFSQRYEKSAYEAETDSATILKVVEGGGYQMYPYRPEGVTVKKIKVGTPVVGYMRYWLPRGNTSDELLIPSLVFPVLGETDPYNQTKSIIVPLAKELLSQSLNGGYGRGGPIDIMPLKVMEGSVTSPGSTGVAQ